MGLITGLVDRLFAVSGALAFCQFPEFLQQYQSRLAGHLGECTRQLMILQQNAQMGGKSLEALAQKFLQQSDPDFIRQGEMITGVMVRQEELQHALMALQSAPAWNKPFLFMHLANLDIVSSTWHNFAPGLTLTTETLCYGLIGLGVGVLLFTTLKGIVKGIYYLMRRKGSKAVVATT
jgi:hypothetical protein